MAKIAQLSQGTEQIYPKTITDAIGVVGKAKLLTTYLTEIDRTANGWTLEANPSGQTLTFTLYKIDATNTKTAVSTINIAQDIYLDDVDYIASAHTMVFHYNTASGKQDIPVDLTDLVDPYYAEGSGITLDGATFKLVLDPSTDNILTRSENGLKVAISATGDTYVGAAIDSNNKNKVVITPNVITASSMTGNLEGALVDAKAIKDYVDAQTTDLAVTAEGDTGATALVTAEVNAEIDNKHVIVASTGKLKNAVASAETALQGIEKNGDYLTVSTKANNSQTVGLNVADDLTGTLTNKVADASAVKTYVDGKVNDLNANVSGASGAVTVQVIEASGIVTNVNVTATTASVKNTISDENALAKAKDVKEHIKDSIDALNADVTGQTTDTFIKVQVTEESGKTASVVVTDTVVAVSAANASNKGLAEASDVKGYVDGEITKSDIKASADITPTKGNDGTTLAINYGSIASGAASAVTGGDIYAWGVTATLGDTANDGQAWPA